MIACVNIIAADTDEKAHRLATSFYQMALGIIRGRSYPLRPAVDSMEDIWTRAEAAAIQSMMVYTFVGSKKTIRKEIQQFIEHTDIAEIMVTTNIYDHEERLASFKITAEVLQDLND